MACKKCKKDKRIVNKFHGLCTECNNERLHGSKYGKRYKTLKNSKKYLKSNKNSNYEKDNNFYKECFDSCKVHKCEECNVDLPKVFEHDGKVVARWRYSHIIPKSIAPKLRRVIDNINHLCFNCHSKWEFGDKMSMKIYDKNQEKYPNYLNPKS